MGYIENLIEQVDSTHSSLGELIAILQIAVKSRQFMMIVSPSGCGKSTAMDLVGKSVTGSIMPDRLSVAGIATIADKLTSFRSVVVVDDIATTGTDYARKSTITTLCALVYTHRIESIMAGIEYTVEDFHGSALIGIQPILLNALMLSEEWDASIQDKTLRYYHLHRPITPALSLPDVVLVKGLDYDTMDDLEPDTKNPYWDKLLALGSSQWSRARAKQHMIDMLKGIAALEQRKYVIPDDYSLLLRLLKPMAVENVVVFKEQLEGERQLDNSLLALLTEYFTYGGEFALAQIAADFKISIAQAYKIMKQHKDSWQQISKSPTRYRPSEKLQATLATFDLEIKQPRLIKDDIKEVKNEEKS